MDQIQTLIQGKRDKNNDRHMIIQMLMNQDMVPCIQNIVMYSSLQKVYRLYAKLALYWIGGQVYGTSHISNSEGIWVDFSA